MNSIEQYFEEFGLDIKKKAVSVNSKKGHSYLGKFKGRYIIVRELQRWSQKGEKLPWVLFGVKLRAEVSMIIYQEVTSGDGLTRRDRGKVDYMRDSELIDF